ncbi:hypothetical protein ACHWQZ_G013087 [Mnemiopsis leidyi]
MNSLVGYGSSGESDSEPEVPEKPQENAKRLTNGSSVALQKAQLAKSPSFPPIPEDIDKKLDISDDEDSYIPSKSSSRPSNSVSQSTLVKTDPPKPSSQVQNLSEVIEKAQIVTVERQNLQSKEGAISSFLPKPKQNTVHELELERLHKSKRRKKDKKKIFVLDLEDFSDEEEVKQKPKRPVSARSASGLFSILPEPKNCKITTKSTKSVVPDRAKLMKPRTIQPAGAKSKPEFPDEDVIEDNEQNGSDFFSFTSSKKSSKEIAKAARTVKLDEFKPKQVSVTPATLTVKGELRSIDAITTPLDQTYIEPEVQIPIQDMSDVPAEFRDFAFNSAEVVDVNQEIQSTDEWALKNLDYSDDKPQSSGKCPLKGQTRRKNQINYLAWQAKEREADLKKQWGDNRMNRHATQSKYGFR